jgi:hypothetical protein
MQRFASVGEIARDFEAYVNRVALHGEHFLLMRGRRAVAELRPVMPAVRLRDLPGLLASLPSLGPEGITAFEDDLAIAREQMRDLPKNDLGDSDRPQASDRTSGGGSTQPHIPTSRTQIRTASILLVAVAALGSTTGVAGGQSPAELRAAQLRATTGTLVGQVTDSASGRPIAGVWVLSKYFGDVSDSAGHFRVIYLDPPRQRMRISTRGYLPREITVPIVGGRTDTLVVQLATAPAPCCKLTGTWDIEFRLEQPGALAPKPRARRAAGSIRFSPEIPDPLRGLHRTAPLAGTDSTRVRREFGAFDVDFSPFFGGRLASDISTTVMGAADREFYREARGAIFNGDSVEIDLIPRISHGGVSFAGVIRGDSVSGRWEQRAYCCGAVGRFVMRRRKP